MNQIQIFKNSDFGEVRTVTIENEPWFVGKDVADALGYSESHKAIQRHVDEEDRMKHPILTEGGVQDAWIINESGMYSLILSSRLPNAKQFKRWVTSEVIPQIRKTGSYMPDASALSPELALMNALVVQMNQEALSRQKLQSQIEQTTERLEETKEELQEIRYVVEVKPFDNWRDDTNKLIAKICHKTSNYKDTRTIIYEALNKRAGSNIKQRLENMRARALLAGMTRSKAEGLSYLDVIAEDKKLIEIYTAIVKEMAIKKGIN